jgi:Bacteriocin-protection, YdeI or OmpD-Associated/Domain of unknown function (DUF1905)
MGERVRFEVELQPEGSSAYAVVPHDIGARIGVRGRTSVVGTLNGHPFRNQVMPYGFEDGSRRLLMPVNNAVRKAAGGLRPGDTVTFELERDDASRSASVEMPADLEQALAIDAGRRAAWDALSPSRRREAAEHIASAKRAETRARRLEELLASLR